MTQANLKERRWEVMEVGEEFGPISVTVDAQLIKDFAYAVDDFDMRYLSPDGPAALGHPTLLCREARDVIRTAYDIASGGAGMHTKHECEIHSCPRIGETYTVTGRHVEKYLKREKQYIVLEAEARDAAGNLVLSQRSTHIRALKPGVAKPVPTAVPADAPQEVAQPNYAEPHSVLHVGARLRPLVKIYKQEHLTVFAGTDWANIHNDPAIARAAGLRGTVASGLQTMAAVSELMTRYFGEGWREGGRLAVAFTAPAFVNDRIEVGAAVKELGEESGRPWVLLDIWCDAQTGARVLAGTARAWVRE